MHERRLPHPLGGWGTTGILPLRSITAYLIWSNRSMLDAFQHTYEAMQRRTSTAWVPWYLIPANQREQTYAAVAAVLVNRFTALPTDYPVVGDAARHTLAHARAALHAAQGQAADDTT